MELEIGLSKSIREDDEISLPFNLIPKIEPVDLQFQNLSYGVPVGFQKSMIFYEIHYRCTRLINYDLFTQLQIQEIKSKVAQIIILSVIEFFVV